MGLFSAAAIAKINAAAAKMKESADPPKAIKTKTLTADLLSIKERVLNYFKDSDAILITTKEQLHNYVDKCIESGIIGVDTETTGLDRQKDYIVGTCLCYKDGPCAYIPHKHRVPIFENLFQNQLTYEDTAVELQRMVDAKVKSVFANADFDLWFLYKDLKVDFIPSFFYDVQIAWRCIKENEPDNALKVLYNKYVLKGKGDPMKFNDFFSPELFPYCEPEVAKLYAANDAKITLELYFWQLPYITKDNPKCKKHNFERIADLVWNLEMPLVPVCQQMQRDGMHFDQSTASVLSSRYAERLQKANAKLAELVQDIIDNTTYTSSTKRPFASGKDFKESSPLHVRYLLYTMLNIPQGKSGQSTDKEKLKEINLPVTNQILEVRSLTKLIGTYVDKLPHTVGPDGNIHAQFRQIGADTGRLSSANPNLQNLPSKATDIRHMFRASTKKDYLLDQNRRDDEDVVFSVPYGHLVSTTEGLISTNKLSTDHIVILCDDTGADIQAKIVNIQETASTVDLTCEAV